MANNWTLEKLNSYILEGVEENLYLDYKASGSLTKEEKKKNEISKDVSAFANSAGGVIIYGISEFQDGPRHRPEKIDPISRKQFSKEALEQIINSRISPRIQGIIITPVPIEEENDDLVVYVVEIPKGNTAHQAGDKRYYRRFNFESVSMEDWEIKDIINRHVRAAVEIKLKPMFDPYYLPMYMESKRVPMEFALHATNIGNKVIKYLEVFIVGSSKASETLRPQPTLVNGFFELNFSNELELKATIAGERFLMNVLREPILPQTFRRLGQIEILSDFFIDNLPLKITATMDDNRFSKTVRGKEFLELIKE